MGGRKRCRGRRGESGGGLSCWRWLSAARLRGALMAQKALPGACLVGLVWNQK